MIRRLLALLPATVLAACATPDVIEATRSPGDLDVTGDVRVERLWSVEVGSAGGPARRLEPAVSGDRLFVASGDGRVMALEAETGRRLWTQELDRPLSGGPAVGDGLLVIGTRDGEVLGLSAEDGERLWRSGVTSEVLAPAAVSSQVVIARANDGRVFALEADNGERRWIYDRNVPVLTLRGHSSPVLVQGGAVVGFDNGRVAALELADGTPVWETSIGVPQGRTDLERMVDVDADPVVSGGDLFAAAYQGRIAGMALRDGRIAWARDMSVEAGLAVDESNVYAVDTEGRLWALDRLNGASVWRQDGFAGLGLSPPALHGGYVAVGGSDGYINWLAPDDGRIVARQRVDGTRIDVRPLADGPRLYVLSLGGRLTAWRIED